MQTGYDNFWMYQNNRQEPVHNLQKNDNYVYPALTDSYKQLQNGGCPSNTIGTSFNNVARTQNNHYGTGPQYMWPSSMYSLPFNSSYSNNFHSQGFPNQTSNFNYSSHYSQTKTGVRNLNVNASQKSRSVSYSSNNKQVTTNRYPQISNYTDTENARIRVKDVFTLNSDSICNAMLDNNSAQSQKSKQYEYPLNYNANNSNRTCDFVTNVPVSQHHPVPYVRAEQPHLNNQQHFHQCSGTTYQQNNQISSAAQIQFNSNSQRRSNLLSIEPKTKSTLLSHLLRNNRNDEENQNNFCNSQDVNKTANLKPNGTNHLNCFNSVNSHSSTERSNNISNHDSTQANKNSTYDNSYTNGFSFLQNQSQNQVGFPNIDQTPSLNQISSLEESRKKQMSEQIATSKTKSFCKNQINNLGNNFVSGQSTFINAVESNNSERNCSLGLPSCLESSSEIYHDPTNKNNTQNYIQHNSNPLPENSPVRRQTCNKSPGRNNAYNISPRSLTNDCNPTARNSNCAYYNGTGNIPENFNTNICDENENSNEFIEISPEAEPISNCEIVLDGVLVKQEISTLGADSPKLQHDHNIHVDYVLEEIKTEDYSEEFQLEQEPQFSENSTNLPSNSDVSKSVDFNKNEKHTIVPETFVLNSKISTDCKNAKNCTLELAISGNAISENDKTEKNTGNQEGNLEKVKTFREEGKYVSKINRDKLDLLIEFLKKEDEVVKIKTSEENHQEISAKKISDESEIKKEVTLSCSRRKLSKTLIVKNKNNSREMVSLVSSKTSRAESQNSPKTPQTPDTSDTPDTDTGNSHKEEERKCICSAETKTNEKLGDVSEKEIKSYDSPKESEKQKKSVAKIENISESGQIQEDGIDEEKNILQIMQALQNLKSHFCLSCTMVSPIESFWINVVSGELRCLNCFKKMTFKADENIIKFKRACIDDKNVTEVAYFLEDSIQKRNENKKENKLEMFCNNCKCECTGEKSSKELKVNIKQEEAYPVKEAKNDKIVYSDNEERNITPKCKNTEMKDSVQCLESPRKKSIEEQKKSKLEESQDKSEKNQNSDEKPSPIKSRKKSSSVENQVIGSSSTVSHSKQFSDPLGKKNASREENESPNPKSCCDILKKEKKPSGQSGGKSKEYKTFISKEGVEQEMRTNGEKSVKKNLFTEEDVLESGKKDKKQFKDSGHSRKRSNSKEEVGSHKARISEEKSMDASTIKSPKESFDFYKHHIAEGIVKKSTNESSDKSRVYSKESYTDQKTKISKHVKSKSPSEDFFFERKITTFKNVEKEKSESGEQFRKRRTSMEELIPRKIRITEERSKITKQIYEKTKTTSKADEAGRNKTSEHSKHFTAELTPVSRRKSKDEWLSSKSELKNFKESSDKTRRSSTSKENFSSPERKKETKSQSSLSENKEKKYFLGKIPKVSHKSTEKSNYEVNKSPPREGKHQKTNALSKPLKESQRTESEPKISSPTQLKKKHENRHKHDGKITDKKKGDDAEDKLEKKKYEKSQTVKQSNKEKALECIFGRKKENHIMNEFRKACNENPPSAKLLERLIEKTKKLSETLLNKP